MARQIRSSGARRKFRSGGIDWFSRWLICEARGGHGEPPLQVPRNLSRTPLVTHTTAGYHEGGSQKTFDLVMCNPANRRKLESMNNIKR